MSKKIEYKRLGDYIRQVDVRNKDLKVKRLMGINIDKFIMPSVANVIGTDLSNYKLVRKGQFACNFMHVGRDEKIPMALLNEDDSIIVSPAYYVFEVLEPSKLLPEYLMMWFRRTEFDRNAWFYTDADVRGGLPKDSFLDMCLPIPSIERQREIVSQYEFLSRRIRINEQMISKLEDTAQALYRKMFVDGIDKENLPEGWRLGMLGEVADSQYGYTEVAREEEIGPKFLRITDIVNKHIDWSSVPYCPIAKENMIKYQLEQYDIVISRTGANIGWAKQIRNKVPLCVYASFLVRFRPVNHIYGFYLGISVESQSYKDYIWANQQGSAQPQANAQVMASYSLLIPCENILYQFNVLCTTIYEEINIKIKEVNVLKKMQSFLIRMAQF